MNDKKWWTFRLKKYSSIYENGVESDVKALRDSLLNQHGFPESVLDRLIARSVASKWLEKLLARLDGEIILKDLICESLDYFFKRLPLNTN